MLRGCGVHKTNELIAERITTSVTKKSTNVYKSCPKMISLKMIDFDTFTKIA